MDPGEAAVSVRDTFGAAYVGAMVMMILYGITCLQTYFFYIHYPNDDLFTKLLVLSIWTLDTFHAVLVSHTMYFYLVSNYNNPLALQDHTWSLCLSLGVNVLIACIVQTFFTHKIHGLSGRNWWLTGPTALMILSHFAFGLGKSHPIQTTVGFFIKRAFHRLPELKYIAVLPFAITAVLSDIMITVALCYLLQNRKTSFRSTNELLNLLIIYAINRCLVVSILAVVEVILFVSLPGTFWFLALDFVGLFIGFRYANSLLATLNSRHSLRGKGLGDSERFGSTGPELSTLDGYSPTAIEIAGVTPSMISRSRMVTSNQTGQTSMAFSLGHASRTSASRSTEVKEFKVSIRI
ncbi:hypothetical protein ACEPAH_7892 [Sanghuangporus vaninii]